MKDVAEVTMQNAATEVRGDATAADVTVSCDGTWQRRGFSSKNGVRVEKLECCGHIQKRMNRRLMDKVRQLKSTVFVNDGKSVKRHRRCS